MTQDVRAYRGCRFCRSGQGEIVVDLGSQPACDHFPLATDPGPDPTYPLRMWLCTRCGLAQLAEDPTVPDEPRGREPEALVNQAAEAVSRVAVAGLLPAVGSVAEYGSPHGGSWLHLLTSRGLQVAATDEPADVVIDCFGLMHGADQKAALAQRAARLRPGGLLLLQFHSLATIVRAGQWNALRHGHYAYYSTPVLTAMLESVGLTARTAWRFPLYGGTVLIAATRNGEPTDALRAVLAEELAAGVLEPEVVGGLQIAAETAASGLARWAAQQRAEGQRVLGYSAASRSIALLCRAGLTPELLPAIADAAPAKRGRRMPGSGIPVITTDELTAARPDTVLLFVPDLLPEVRASLPQIESEGGRWVLAEGSAGLA
ncbi:MAG: methyltransferase C-terminal domain-containing protein [Pseudonocardiales bacterium]